MLQILLLGPPEVSIDGRPIVVDTRKAIALLAYLVVEKSASRDSLAALLWAESSQERARATLRRTLSALRGAGGADLIEADRNLVMLVGDVSSDLDVLSAELVATGHHEHDAGDVCGACIPHLRRATSLYRGDFLEGFSVKTSPDFEDWTRGVAESTRLRVGAAFNRLATALAANGEYPDAISSVSKWIELDPLHEPAHRFLMLLHAWAGDRPGAIEAYRNCVSILEQELGVPPLEETTELYEAILDEDLPPAPGARRKVKAETPPRRAPADLIDREAELETLHQALRDTRKAPGRLITVTGAPWMGKTRLLEELAGEAASQDRRVLIGRSFRMEQALPYGVATQLLRAIAPQIAGMGPEVPEWAMTELGRLVPEMRLTAPDTLQDRLGELRLLEGVFTVISALANERPILMILDDAQWLDPASASLFAYLARRVSTLPILMLVALRPGDDLHPGTEDMIANSDQTLEIAPLGVQHLAPLVEGDETAAIRLRRLTGGVPLLVAEALISDDAGSATAGMSRYMESRLREVGDLGRQILTAASVLNGICDADLLRETSGRSDEEVVDAVEELVTAGLLRELPESDGLSFTLDALEHVAYESTSMVRRRLLHRRAGHALAERAHSRTDPRLAAAVAGQYQAAGEPEAASWFHLAGDLARSIHANDSARRSYETALALGDTDVAGIRLAMGELAMAGGEYGVASRELTLAEAYAGTDLIGIIEHRTGEVERQLGRFQVAEERFERSIETHPSPADVYADWALLAHRTGETIKAGEMADRALLAADEGEDSLRLSRVRNILAVVTPDPDAALDHVEEA
ncbi:MAG: BTAD domain-containing putative transcriptional regulator, partial [Acidimicrobiia bacterium]